jgi:diguanylate cyclase (GGDEF)-like protein
MQIRYQHIVGYEPWPEGRRADGTMVRRWSSPSAPLKSIRYNLLAFALLATLLPSLALGLVSFLRFQDLANEAARRELRALAREANDELVLWRRARAHDLRTLASAYTLSDGLGAPAIGTDGLALYLRSVARKLDGLVELTLFDSHGAIIASSAAVPAAVALPERWTDSAIADGAILAPPGWDPTHGAATMIIAYPVRSARDEWVGALAGVVDLRTVTPGLRAVVGSLSAEIVVLAADGTPLLATGGPASALQPLPAAVLAQLRADDAQPLAFTGFRQRDVLGIAAPPGALPIVVVATRERADVFRAWLELAGLYLALAAGLLVVVGLVAYWMGRSIVTPLAALTDAADRVASGNLDVALRDESRDEIGRLTRAFSAMVARLRTSQAALAEANASLREQKAGLETLAATDSLTRLANRTRLASFMGDEFGRFAIHGKPFALLMVDVDNLPAINGDFGLATGDDVLVTFAALLRQAVRPVDLVARFGGETFVVVLVDTPFDDAMAIAERIRAMTDASAFNAGPRSITVAVSIGVAQSRAGDANADAVLFRADHARHAARHAGGNRVHAAM